MIDGIARPVVDMPVEMWDALCALSNLTDKRPADLICEQIAYFLINDWEELVRIASVDRAAEVRGIARDYLGKDDVN